MDCDQIFRKRDGYAFEMIVIFNLVNTNAHILFTFCYELGEACGFIFRLSKLIAV